MFVSVTKFHILKFSRLQQPADVFCAVSQCEKQNDLQSPRHCAVDRTMEINQNRNDYALLSIRRVNDLLILFQFHKTGSLTLFLYIRSARKCCWG